MAPLAVLSSRRMIRWLVAPVAWGKQLIHPTIRGQLGLNCVLMYKVSSESAGGVPGESSRLCPIGE